MTDLIADDDLMHYTLIDDSLPGYTGEAWHIRLDEPVEVIDYGGTVGEYADFIVSATIAPYTGSETYVFPATEDGEIADWGELPGSQRGTLDHTPVIAAFLNQIEDGRIGWE